MQSFAWVRNPLGILALFISLIYGMSVAMFGMSVSSLTPINQLILTVFIVGFPFAVLGAFVWLVAKHHTKLYGPSDYRDDAGFLKSISGVSVGERIMNEVKEGIAEGEADSKDAATGASSVNENDKKAASGVTGPIDGIVLRATFAETMLFLALERDLGGFARREIQLGPIRVDGIIETTTAIYIIEAKYRQKTTLPANVIRQATDRLVQACRSFLREQKPLVPVRGIIAFVYDSPGDNVSKVLPTLAPAIEMRVYAFAELERRFGFTSGSHST